MRFRAATRTDKRAIAAFCTREDPDDYIPEWIDRFFRQGAFYLLLDGSRIAGIVHGQVAPDTSAWMSAARIHHDYRGHGWINKLNEYAFASKRLTGAHAARMLITSDNTSSIRAAEKGGFHLAATLSFVDWEATSKPRARPIPSGFSPLPPDKFLPRAVTSAVFHAQHGLVYAPFTGAFEPNPRALKQRADWLYGSFWSGPLMAAMFADTGERWLGAQPFLANQGVAERLIDFAREQQADSMTVILPAGGAFTEPFLQEGYTRSEWATKVHVFEKPLKRRGAALTPLPARGAAARPRKRR